MAKLFGPDLPRLARQHLVLVAVSVGVATLIGVPLAVWVFPHLRLRALVLGATGLLQTVPSLALLAVLLLYRDPGFMLMLADQVWACF